MQDGGGGATRRRVNLVSCSNDRSGNHSCNSVVTATQQQGTNRFLTGLKAHSIGENTCLKL